MIRIKETKHGLKKGQKFDEMKVDGKLAVLKSKKRIAFIPVDLLTKDFISESISA